jgi:hypothetical protein
VCFIFFKNSFLFLFYYWKIKSPYLNIEQKAFILDGSKPVSSVLNDFKRVNFHTTIEKKAAVFIFLLVKNININGL